MIKIHPVKCEAYDEDDNLVFTLNTFDSECHELTIKALVDAENWPRIAKAVSFTLAYMDAGLTVADPLDTPDEVPDA